jgi:hypothetical protein
MGVSAVWIGNFKADSGRKKMNFNFGEVLGRTWEIGWNHKVFWLWQMLPSAAIIFILPSAFIFHPVFTELIQDPDMQIPIKPWMSISLNSLGVLFVLSYALIWIFAQVTTICGAVEIEKGKTNISFRELFHKSLPYVWHVLGLYFLFILFLGVLELVNFGFVIIFRAIYKDISAIPFFLFIFWVLPLSLALLVSIVVAELSLTSIVANDMRVVDSVLHAWKILKSNGLSLTLLMIIVYFGAYIPLSLLSMPFLFLVFGSLWFLTRLPDPNVIFFTVFFIIIPFMIIFAISFYGVFMTFFQTAWAVVYMRLSNNANTPMVVEEKSIEAGI